MKNIFIAYKRDSFQHLVNTSGRFVVKMNNDKNHDIVTLLAYFILHNYSSSQSLYKYDVYFQLLCQSVDDCSACNTSGQI